jgi:hypothetical protein
MEFKIMMCELCSIKDFIVHWVTVRYAGLIPPTFPSS